MEKLGSDPSWLSLGHYRSSGWFNDSWESEADDEEFFFSSQGKHSPLEELRETNKQQFIEKDLDAICQFPARYRFLAVRKGINPNIALDNCAELNSWKNKLDAVGATLIFPAAYLDSPSSMFGHTLLRLDQDKTKDSSGQLSYTYSFAAQMPESGSELEFVYRGLVGGYPGETSTPPYYLKLKEYQDIESRDIWEYSLNFSPEEIDQLLNHMWEIKDIDFDYFFFGENCSYRVMALLDAVRPGIDLLVPERIYTIPVVTVRDAISADIVSDWRFRPSTRTQLEHDFAQLSKDEKNWVKHYVSSNADTLKEGLQTAPPSRNVLDVAYQYSRMLPASDQEAKQKSFTLLRAQNIATEESTLSVFETPQKRDDEGHESERISLSLGSSDIYDFVEFEIRPAYHELLDPSQGYPAGSELVFGKASVRYNKADGLSVEDVTVLSIKSLKSTTALFNPTSWAVSISADRENADSSNRFSPSLKGNLGKTYKLSDRAIIFALGGGEARFNTKLNSNLDVIAAFNAGAVYNANKFRTQFDYRLTDSVSHGSSLKHSFELKAAYQLTKMSHLSVRTLRNNLDENDKETSIGVHVFF